MLDRWNSWWNWGRNGKFGGDRGENDKIGEDADGNVNVETFLASGEQKIIEVCVNDGEAAVDAKFVGVQYSEQYELKCSCRCSQCDGLFVLRDIKIDYNYWKGYNLQELNVQCKDYGR